MMSKGTLWFWAGVAGALALGWFGFPRVLYRNVEQPLQFSHQVHTGESVGMSCNDCHSFAPDGRFTGIPTVAKCAECHSAPLGETAAELKLVEEYVTPNREIPWLVYSRQPDNAYFSHIQHVQLGGMACEQCHGPHGASETLRPLQVNRLSGYSRDLWGQSLSRWRNQPWEGKKMDDCVRCHNQSGRASGCLDCHK